MYKERKWTFFAIIVWLPVMLACDLVDVEFVKGIVLGASYNPSTVDHFPAGLAHILGFAVLSFLVFSPKRKNLGVISLLIASAIAMECLQSFSPSRFFELSDIANNLAGVAIGIGLKEILARWPRRKILSTKRA